MPYNTRIKSLQDLFLLTTLTQTIKPRIPSHTTVSRWQTI